MTTLTEIEKLVFDLPESQRATLAAHLLHSLPAVLYDEDEGIAEAMQRDADFSSDATFGVSLNELDQQIKQRRS